MFIKSESDKDQDQDDRDNRESNDGEMWHLFSQERVGQLAGQSQADKRRDWPNFGRVLIESKGLDGSRV
jgi:hypothetical protein